MRITKKNQFLKIQLTCLILRQITEQLLIFNISSEIRAQYLNILNNEKRNTCRICSWYSNSPNLIAINNSISKQPKTLPLIISIPLPIPHKHRAPSTPKQQSTTSSPHPHSHQPTKSKKKKKKANNLTRDIAHPVQELHATCKAMQERVVDLIGTLAHDELMAELLQINDDMNNLFLRYTRFVGKGRGAMPASALVAQAIGASGSSVAAAAAAAGNEGPTSAAARKKLEAGESLIDLSDDDESELAGAAALPIDGIEKRIADIGGWRGGFFLGGGG